MSVLKLKNIYTLECRNADGSLAWEETIENLVTTEGVNDVLDVYLNGGTQTTNWYVGLMAGGSPVPTPAATDTLDSHPGWTEFTGFTDSPNVRQALTLGSISSGSVDNSASKAAFTISTVSPDSQSVGGAFLTSDQAVGNSSPVGILYSAAAFTGGDQVVSGGQTLSVTVTCTAASA